MPALITADAGDVHALAKGVEAVPLQFRETVIPRPPKPTTAPSPSSSALAPPPT